MKHDTSQNLRSLFLHTEGLILVGSLHLFSDFLDVVSWCNTCLL